MSRPNRLILSIFFCSSCSFVSIPNRSALFLSRSAFASSLSRPNRIALYAIFSFSEAKRAAAAADDYSPEPNRSALSFYRYSYVIVSKFNAVEATA